MTSCSHCGLSHIQDDVICPITEESLDVPGLCGTTLDRYRVEKWLGGGGFGAVYRASHTVMDRPVALKILHAQMRTKPLAVKRFFGEAKAATAIGHPGIVQVFDAGTTDAGHAFLAMELVDGCSLKELAEAGPIRPARALRIAMAVLDALAAAHAAGIIHRDVKPGNIMLGGTTPDGSQSEDSVRLVDFGVSKARQTKAPEEITRSGMAMGSPGYASPEQYVSAKTADGRSDIYGVSVVLYQLLAGSLPFEAESYEQMVVQVCSKEPRPLSKLAPGVPPKLTAIVDRGVARDPNARWQRAQDMIAALTPWVERLEGAIGPTQVAPSTPPPKLDSYESKGLTPTFIEAEPDEPPPAVESASSKAARLEPSTEADAPPARRGGLLLAGLLLLLLGGAAAAGLVIGGGDEAAPDLGVVESAPMPVVPEPLTEPTIPVPVSDSPTALEEEPPGVSEVEATMTGRRAERRRNRRGRMRPQAMGPEMAVEMAAPMGMGSEFGLEDIEPFDPD